MEFSKEDYLKLQKEHNDLKQKYSGLEQDVINQKRIKKQHQKLSQKFKKSKTLCQQQKGTIDKLKNNLLLSFQKNIELEKDKGENTNQHAVQWLKKKSQELLETHDFEDKKVLEELSPAKRKRSETYKRKSAILQNEIDVLLKGIDEDNNLAYFVNKLKQNIEELQTDNQELSKENEQLYFDITQLDLKYKSQIEHSEEPLAEKDNYLQLEQDLKEYKDKYNEIVEQFEELQKRNQINLNKCIELQCKTFQPDDQDNKREIIQDYIDQINSLTKNQDSLKIEMRNKQQQIEKIMKEHNQLEKINQTHTQKCEHLETTLQQYKYENEQYKSQYSQSDDKIGELQGYVEQYQYQLTQKCQEIEANKQEYEDKYEELNLKQSQKYNHLQNSLYEINQNIKTNKDQNMKGVEQLTHEHTQKCQELEDLNKKQELEYKWQLDAKTEEIESLTKQLQEFEKKRQTDASQIMNLNKKYQMLIKLYKQQTPRGSPMRSPTSSPRKQSSSPKQQLDIYQAEKEENQTENSQLIEQTFKLEQALKLQQEEHNQQLEKFSQENEENYQKHFFAMDEVNKKYKKMARELAQKTSQLEEATNQRNKFKRKNSQHLKKCNDLQNFIQKQQFEHKQELAKKTSQVYKHNEECNDLEELIGSQKIEYQEEIEIKTEEIYQKNLEIHDLREKCNQYEQELQSLQNENADTKNEYQQL